MLKVILVPGETRLQMTARLAGAALCTEVSALQAALRGALAQCEELTLDLTGVERLDASFPALVCALHRQSLLSHKRITLRGTPLRCGEALPFAGVADCRFKKQHQPCPLWDPVSRGAGSCRWP